MDDSIQQVIDPRGAITNFTYNDPRGLVTQISYDAPVNPPTNITIPDTPNVNFSYDNLGNRTVMNDGTGTMSYVYDQLSRMTAETKDFTDLTNNLTIAYSYHLGGGLKSITDPFNSTVNYANDKTGKVTAVSGTPWGQNTTGNYANNIKYRAFGQIKQIDYQTPNDTPQIKLEYDNRLRVNHSEVTSSQITSGYLMKADFTYSADSRLQSKNDLLDTTSENKWDRTMKYDFAGRLTFNQFGIGLGSDNQTPKRVYQQTIQYDGFSQMTSRSTIYWGENNGFTESYINGRIQSTSGLTYDAAGNIAHSGSIYSPHDYQQTTFDAAGRRIAFFSSSKGRQGSLLNVVRERKTEQIYDGEGRPVIEKSGAQSYQVNDPPPPPITTIVRAYQIWSTVLGSSLTTLTPSGEKQETKVFAGGAVIARQGRFVENNQTSDSIQWTTADPVTGTVGKFGYSANGNSSSTEEIEPLGQTISSYDQSAELEPPPPPANDTSIGRADDPHWQCLAPREFYGGFSGLPFHCQKAILQDLNQGLADIYGFSQQEENPIKIADSPLLDFAAPNSASDEMLTDTLTLTSKKDKEKKKKRKEKKPENVIAEVQSLPAADALIESNNAEFGIDDVSNTSKNNGLDVADITYDNIITATETCLNKLWGIENTRKFSITDASWAAPGASGYFNITELSFLGNIFSVIGRTIKTDATSYSSKQLSALGKEHLGIDRRLIGLTLYNIQKAPQFVPHTNYVSNNSADYKKSGFETGLQNLIGKFITNQIHELGNSIQGITAKPISARGKYEDKDSGIALEECVYGKLKPQ